MNNGLYAYFGTDKVQRRIQYGELNVLGDWDATQSYFASNNDAVYFGTNGTYLAILDNLSVYPNASTNSTNPYKWSPLALISVMPPSAISNILISGNTAGQTDNINGVLVLAGGDNVTLSQESNTISFVAGGGTGGGGGGAAISAGTNSQNTGTVVFSNSNGVSFGLNTNGVLTASYTAPSTAGLLSAVNLSAGTLSNNLSAVTFSNSNGVTFGLDTNSAVTASVQTNYQSPGAYLTTAMQSNASTISNINISAGTLSNNLSALTFSNSNGISFGLDTNSVITATVATNYQSAGAYLTTAMLSNAATISNINISAGSTSTNVSAITFSNSNGVTFGLGTGASAGVITASASGDGPGGGAAISAGINSQNTGTVVFANSNGVSFGLDTNGSLTATVVTNYQTPGAYLTTAMLSNAATISNIKVSAGASSSNVSAITFSNGSGVTFGYDGTNITASVKTDYQTSGAYLTTAMLSNAATISNIKISGGTLSNNLSALTFGDSNGVSWGLNTNSVITATVQTNYLTTAMLSNAATISNIKVSAGASSSNVSAITFSNGSGVTWGYDGTNITASVATSYLTTAMLSNAATISNIKVSAGASSSNVSAITFSNGSGVTWGYDGTNITASVATSYLTTAMLSNAATISNIKVSAGASSSNVSAITFSNGSGVTWGYDGTNITASVATSYLTTAALSQNTSNYAGINSAITGGSLTVNTSGISINLPAYLTTAALSTQTLQFTLGGNTATTNSSQIANGGFILAGGNNLTIQQNNNTISLSVGNYITTADLSQNSSKYAGLNSAITGGSLTVNTSGISINLPAYLTTAALSQNTSNYAGINSAITGGSLTVNTSGVSINLPAYLTTAMLSNAATISNIKISAGASSSNVSAITFSNGSGVSFGYDGTNITASVAAGGSINLSAGSTSTNATAFTFNNSNGITFGLGTGASAGIITATVATNTINQTGPNISAGSDSLFTGGTVTFGNAFGVSFKTSNGSVVASNALLSAWSLAGNNTAGTNNSAQGSALYLSAGPGMTLSGNSNTIVISNPYCGWLEPYPMTNTALFGPGAGSWYFAPFVVPEFMSGGRINLLHVNTSTAGLFIDITSFASGSTGTLSQVYTYSKAVALYSAGIGANSTCLLSFWSNSFSLGWSKSVAVQLSNASQINITVAHSLSYISDIGSDGAYTKVQYANSSAATVANSSTASTAYTNVFTSGRNLLSNSIIEPIGFNTTIPPGAYWLAFAWSSTRGTSTTGGQLVSAPDFSVSSEMGLSRLTMESAFRNFGSTATTARSHIMPYGLYTGAANMAPPATVNLSSDLSSLASAWIPYFNFQLQGLTK